MSERTTTLTSLTTHERDGTLLFPTILIALGGLLTTRQPRSDLGIALVLARAYVAPFSVSPDAAVAQGAAPAIPGAPEVALTAKDIHFGVSEFRLPSTEVNLTLRNDGVLPHDLTIPALGVHVAAGSGQSITTGLRDLPKGRYAGYCGVSGHADAGMELVVIVD